MRIQKIVLYLHRINKTTTVLTIKITTMSHFTVLVLTDPNSDPETLLKPYSESIEVPEYKVEDVSEENKQDFVDMYMTEQDKDYIKITTEEALTNKQLSFDELYEKHGDDWNNSRWKKDAEGVWSEYSTSNPNAKWDWYLLGGRWTGFFKVKKVAALQFQLEGFSTAEVNSLVELYKTDVDKFLKVTSKYKGKTEIIRKTIADMINAINNPQFAEHKVGESGLMTKAPEKGYADQLLKKDIDFEGMRAEAVEKAEKDYDAFHAILNDREFPIWNVYLEMYPDDINTARNEYNNLQTVIDLSNAGYHWNIERYNVTREKFIQKAHNGAFTTFAFLDKNGWHERGDMGWWGIVTHEQDIDTWDEEFNKMLDALPDDTMLSIYDCHI